MRPIILHTYKQLAAFPVLYGVRDNKRRFNTLLASVRSNARLNLYARMAWRG